MPSSRPAAYEPARIHPAGSQFVVYHWTRGDRAGVCNMTPTDTPAQRAKRAPGLWVATIVLLTFAVAGRVIFNSLASPCPPSKLPPVSVADGGVGHVTGSTTRVRNRRRNRGGDRRTIFPSPRWPFRCSGPGRHLHGHRPAKSSSWIAQHVALVVVTADVRELSDPAFRRARTKFLNPIAIKIITRVMGLLLVMCRPIMLNALQELKPDHGSRMPWPHLPCCGLDRDRLALWLWPRDRRD